MSGPDKVAFQVDGQERVTFQNLYLIHLAFAERFLDHGVGAGDICEIGIDDPLPNLVAKLALLRIGATPCSRAMSLDPEFGDLVAFKIVAAAGDIGGNSGAPRQIVIGQDWIAAPTTRPSIVDGGSLIFSTSGTTGRPKYFRLSQGALALRIDRNNQVRGGLHDAVFVGHGIGAFIAFKASMAALLSGVAQTHLGPTPDATYAAIKALGVKHLYLPPDHLDDLLQVSGVRGPVRLKRINVGGTALPVEIARQCEAAFGCAVFNDYGSFETDTIATRRVTEASLEQGFVGRHFPWFEVETRTVAKDQAREMGHIFVRVRPAMQAQSLNPDIPLYDREGWIDTGDLGQVNAADGALVLKGRVADLINIHGNKFSPQQLEAILGEDDRIDDLACFGLMGEDGRESIAIAVVGRAGFEVTAFADRVQTAVGRRAPFDVFLVPEISTTQAGKRSRTGLRDMFSAQTPSFRHRAGTAPD